MHRRRFLLYTLGFFKFQSLAFGRSPARSSLVLLPTKDQNGLAKIDLEVKDPNIKWSPLPYRPHALVELAKNRVLVLPRDSIEYALILSSQTLRPLSEIRASPGATFFGHGGLSPDKKMMVLVEVFPSKGNSQLVFFDLSSGIKRQKTLPLESLIPHDVVWQNAHHLILNQRLDAYGGSHLTTGQSFVCDLKTSQLKPWVQGHSNMSIGHFYKNNGKMFAVTVSQKEAKPQDCFGQIENDKIDFFEMNSSKKTPFKPGALHVAFTDDGARAGVTFPWEGVIRIFDLGSRQVIRTVELSPDDGPLAIEYQRYQNRFYIFATSGKIFELSADLKDLREFAKLESASAESHVYRWNKT
jgi:hypothetical protein